MAFIAILLFFISMISLINKIVNWVLYTSIFASCCAVLMCMATERLILNDIVNIISPLHAFIFGSTLVVYNTHFLFIISTLELSDRYRWSIHYRLWHWLLLVFGFAISAGTLFLLPGDVLVICILLGFLSFAYSLPILPFLPKRRLKDFGWIKIILLTSVWTIVTAVLPMVYHHRGLTLYPLEMLIRFSFMLPLCIAFDIRDMKTDREDGIYTLPNIIGVSNCYWAINFSIAFALLLSIIQYCRFPSEIRLIGEIITGIYIALIIQYVRVRSSDRAYLGLVDGAMLLYGCIILLH